MNHLETDSTRHGFAVPQFADCCEMRLDGVPDAPECLYWDLQVTADLQYFEVVVLSLLAFVGPFGSELDLY